jgi:hypothetical protein
MYRYNRSPMLSYRLLTALLQIHLTPQTLSCFARLGALKSSTPKVWVSLLELVLPSRLFTL